MTRRTTVLFERLCLFVGLFVCLFVCLFIILPAINSPRSSSHFYKLPQKILAKMLLPKKEIPEIVNFKPKSQGGTQVY